MLRTIRNLVTGALVAMLGATGVTYAATGSFNPVKMVTNEAPTAPSEPAGNSNPSGTSTETPTASSGAEATTNGCPAGSDPKTATADCAKKDEATQSHADEKGQEPSGVGNGVDGESQTGDHQGQFGPNDKGSAGANEKGQSNQSGDQGDHSDTGAKSGN